MSDELKPCPYCGAGGDTVFSIVDDGNYAIVCGFGLGGCGATGGWHDNPASAAECWNRRHDPIVGHKTLSDGSHVALHKSEADAIVAHVEDQERRRAELMPDAQAAATMLWEAYHRLQELGWKDPRTMPKGRVVSIVDIGSSGIHDCERGILGDDSFHVLAPSHVVEMDLWPCKPLLWHEKA